MNKKSKIEQIFILLLGFMGCVLLFSMLGCDINNNENNVYGKQSSCEVCNTGCRTGALLGYESNINTCYGGEGCCANRISCGTLSVEDGGYMDCVLGDKCTGCYMGGCLRSSCSTGIRCGGCAMCGKDLIDSIDEIEDFKNADGIGE